MRGSKSVRNDGFLKTTFGKADSALTFLNSYTQGGMFQPRLIDKELEKNQVINKKLMDSLKILDLNLL